MNTMTTSSRFRGLVATAIFSSLGLSVGMVCAAADPTDPPKVVVNYGDLNLSNPQGARNLYSRIQAAAYEVCKPFDIDSRGLESQASLYACVHKAVADAVTKVNQPQLVAIYNAKNRTPLPTTLTLSQNR